VVWLGIALTWVAAAIAEYLWLQERLVVALLATTLGLLLLGLVWSYRIRARDERTLITVQDLRRR
jgi:uncharacterized membrane protein